MPTTGSPLRNPLWLIAALFVVIIVLQLRILSRSLPADTPPLVAPAGTPAPQTAAADTSACPVGIAAPATAATARNWGAVATRIAPMTQNPQAWIVDLDCSTPAAHHLNDTLADGQQIVGIDATRVALNGPYGPRYLNVRPTEPGLFPMPGAGPGAARMGNDTSFKALQNAAPQTGLSTQDLSRFGEVLPDEPAPPADGQ